jgi:MioC protein
VNKSITILFGTESGNAEFAAEDMASEVLDRSVEVIDMSDFEVDTFSKENLYLIICSTHGEGELPSGALPFHEALQTMNPDLTGIEYAMFGLGDSSYENYSKGSEHIDSKLSSLGATRVGEYGRHDADTGTLPSARAVAWVREILKAY